MKVKIKRNLTSLCMTTFLMLQAGTLLPPGTGISRQKIFVVSVVGLLMDVAQSVASLGTTALSVPFHLW